VQYKKLVIYYFSGTGNSKNVAIWLSKLAEDSQTECKLINIAQTDRLNIEKPEADALVIFVSPVHGFNYPPVMLHFLFRFPRAKNNVVLMNTRAGMLIGNWVTPGLSGATFYFASLILALKGFKTKSFFPVNLPSNWISVHPGLNKRTIEIIHRKEKERVLKFGTKIFAGKSDFRALIEILDVLIIPVAILYYFLGRFVISKSYYASLDCDNCGLCIKACPVKAIKTIDNRPYWTFNCESCMRCMSNCPKKAIETGHGFIGIIVAIYFVLLLPIFYKITKLELFVSKYGIVELIFESLIFLGLFAIWYLMIHFLLRFKFFERIIVYTSLTKFKFWGRRYKAIKGY
jgi:ferredoxin/flavodoxin